MSNNERISGEQMILLFGFLFFVLGTLGVIQIGILEGLVEIISISLVLLLIGIGMLVFLIIKERISSS